MRKRLIGYLPENPSLYTALTVREFLRFVGKIRGVEDGTLESRISESLNTFALTDKGDSLVGSLSKGMKQKVALTAANIHDPGVLILDEPLTALDPKTQAFVNRWIASQGRNHKTVFLSTHNLEIVQDYATRIVIIDRGTVIASGGLESLRRLADARGRRQTRRSVPEAHRGFSGWTSAARSSGGVRERQLSCSGTGSRDASPERP